MITTKEAWCNRKQHVDDIDMRIRHVFAVRRTKEAAGEVMVRYPMPRNVQFSHADLRSDPTLTLVTGNHDSDSRTPNLSLLNSPLKPQ